MKIYHIAVDAENDAEVKAFISAGLEGLTTCKVLNWKKVWEGD